MRASTLIFSLLVSGFLSGCSVLPSPGQEPPPPAHPPATQVEPSTRICLLKAANNDLEHNCQLEYWLSFWVDHNALSWPKRKAAIDALGDSTEAILKKVLLSQGKSTPYQDRLRAQGWADQLLPAFTQQAHDLFQVILYQPSQDLLEFESALIILTRMNTNQSKEIEVQKQRLQEQQQQIDQLLKIEASMMEKKEELSQ